MTIPNLAFGGNEGPTVLGGDTTSGPINIYNSELRSRLFGGGFGGGGGGLNIRGPNYRSTVEEAPQSTATGINSTYLMIAAAGVLVLMIMKRK